MAAVYWVWEKIWLVWFLPHHKSGELASHDFLDKSDEWFDWVLKINTS